MSDPSGHRVYDAEAVDRYVEELHQEIEELKNAGSSDEAWRTAEATLGRAMLTAQRDADATLAEAAQKAREIVADAQQRADALLAGAEQRVDEANRLVAEAERQADELRTSIDLRNPDGRPAGAPVLTAFAPPRAEERVEAPTPLRHLFEVPSAEEPVPQYVPDLQNNWPPPVGEPQE